MGKKVIVRSSRALLLPPPGSIPSPLSPSSSTSSSSFKNINPIGIQPYLDTIIQSLKSGNSLIGIWGPGGVGKTTLLSSIHTTLHAEARTRSASFDFIIFAVASLTYNPETIQRHIASCLGLKLPPFATSKTITQSIFDCLKRRSFLLLLDDLWDAVDLTLLGIPDPSAAVAFRRAVVLTTRYKEVCNRMGRNCRLVRLDCLAGDDAFALFTEKVGHETLNSDHRIRKIAEEIINDYCQRLPLALTATGTALSSKKTYEEWVVANRNLKKSSANFPGMGKSFFPLLKLSYDNLDDGAKRCFLSCALWPENYSICNDELIECWMGLGFINELDISAAYSHGCHVINILKGASLLTPGDIETEVRMHQTIRGLALWIASDYGEKREKWIVTLDSPLKTGTHHFNWSNAERVSFMYNDIEAVPLQTKCEDLTTLILKGNMSLTSVPPGFFARMPSLTYLDLSNTGIEELPADIRRLTKLKYLNLSHTRLTSLPMEVEYLKELEYLLLYRTLNMKPIPRKVLLGLSKLRVLDLSASGNGYDLDVRNGGTGSSQGGRAGADILDLECFGRDKNRKSSLALGIMVVSVKALCRLSKLSGLCTRRLCMNNLEGFQGTLDLLSPNLLGSTNGKIGKSLRELTIMNCDRLVKLLMADAARELEERKKTAAAHGPRLLGLEILQLLELRRMKEISWKGVTADDLLPSLRELTIYKCDELKNVSWVLKLPSLEYLQLQECAEMELVIGDEANVIKMAEQAFPKLKGMILDELPSLSKICNRDLGFPALEFLQVSGCLKLVKLPFRSEIRNSNLKKIQGEKMWWECLQWDDKSIKRELLECCFFIPPRAPLTTLPSRRCEPVEKNSSLGSFYRAVLLPISLPFMLLSLSTVLPPSVLLICMFLLFVGRWGFLQR